MKKRLISGLLAAAVAATMLAGCGNGGAQAPQQGETETQAVEETSAPAGETYKIGAIGPETGGASVYGVAVKNGAQIAVDEINAAGGINGYQIEYRFADDEHNAEKSINAYNSLKDWGMQMLVGTVTTAPCLAVIENTHDDNMFQITPSASAQDVIKYDNCFQICFTDPNQGTKSAQYINENLKDVKKVGVIYDSSDAYSSGIYEKFAAEAKSCDFEIVAAEAFTADSKTDFSNQLTKCQSAGADLVFLPFYATEAAIVLTQANAAGYSPIFFGCDGLDGILATDGFDTTLAEGTMLLTPFAADSQEPTTKAFVDAYKAAYGEIPNQFAADAYDAVYTIKAALEMSGAIPTDGVSAICDALVAQMPNITVPGITGGEAGLKWAADGAVDKAPKAVVIADGVYVALD